MNKELETGKSDLELLKKDMTICLECCEEHGDDLERANWDTGDGYLLTYAKVKLLLQSLSALQQPKELTEEVRKITADSFTITEAWKKLTDNYIILKRQQE